MLILIAIVGILAVALAVIATLLRQPSAPAAERVAAMRDTRTSALSRLEGTPAQSLLRSTGRGIGRTVVAFLPSSLYAKTDDTLQRAGRPVTTPGYLLISLVVIVIFSLLGFVLATSSGDMPAVARAALLAAGIAFGFGLPAIWLRNRLRARQRAIWRSLPDASDLLTTCVEAGLGVDAAFVRVTSEIDGPLREEFEIMLREISLGKPRDEAMADVGERTRVPDLEGLLQAVRQAQETGTSLARVLRAQAHHVRTQRKILAEEAARTVPARMTFPIVFLTVPTVFVLILGPIGIELFDLLPV